MRRRLLRVYDLLYRAYGPQHWWPGETPFEVMIGAVLTQAVAWANVEKAIGNLRAAGLLSAAALREVPLESLAALLRPTGYYNAKAVKVKALVQHLERYGDDLTSMFGKDTAVLRGELLSIHGVGEETADSIVLYAAGKPRFVIDAYTRRILGRLHLAPEGDAYGDYQRRFEEHLRPDPDLFNEYHALLVRLGKEVCRRRPLCGICPLLSVCPTGRAPEAGLGEPFG